MPRAEKWKVYSGYVHTHLSQSAIDQTQLMGAMKMQVWGKIIFACLPGIQLIIQGCGEQLSLLKYEYDYSFQLFPETLSSPAHDYLLTLPFHPRRFRPGRGFNSLSTYALLYGLYFPGFEKSHHSYVAEVRKAQAISACFISCGQDHQMEGRSPPKHQCRCEGVTRPGRGRGRIRMVPPQWHLPTRMYDGGEKPWLWASVTAKGHIIKQREKIQELCCPTWWLVSLRTDYTLKHG